MKPKRTFVHAAFLPKFGAYWGRLRDPSSFDESVVDIAAYTGIDLMKVRDLGLQQIRSHMLKSKDSIKMIDRLFRSNPFAALWVVSEVIKQRATTSAQKHLINVVRGEIRGLIEYKDVDAVMKPYLMNEDPLIAAAKNLHDSFKIYNRWPDHKDNTLYTAVGRIIGSMNRTPKGSGMEWARASDKEWERNDPIVRRELADAILKLPIVLD